MSSTFLLIEVTSPDPDKSKILPCLSDSPLLVNEGANLFYRSLDFCSFLMTDDTNYWLCFYGLPKSLEKDTSSQVLNFLEERVSTLNFKFTDIPRDPKSQRFRKIRSISGIIAGFMRAFGTKPSVHSIVGDGSYIKELWKAVTNRKSLPLAPWEKKRLYNNFFDTKSSNDTLEKNQRLKELELKVSTLESKLTELAERFETLSSSPMTTEAIDQQELQVEVSPSPFVHQKLLIDASLESDKPALKREDTVELQLILSFSNLKTVQISRSK